MSFFRRQSSKLDQAHHSDSTRRKARRPEGVSRRRRRELSIEPLEDRRVMSVNSPLAGLTSTSYSSNTAEGLAAILQQELYRAVQQANLASMASNYTNLSIPTDPMLNLQWHLINTGQQVGSPDFQPIFAAAGEDIGVAQVWNQGITGQGVVVGVFELDTLQTTHPDLLGNIDPTRSFILGSSNGDHATAVAGLIGAVANNGIGGTGVAPGVTLVPMSGVNTPGGIEDAFRYAQENGIDIVNNSWGPNFPGFDRGLRSLTPVQLLALRDSVFFGRDGLGTIFVFSAGNDGKLTSTSSYNGFVNSRYTIGVTGVDHDGQYNNIDGTVTGYPEVGSSVLVAAPTGSNTLRIVDDFIIGSGIFTTDVTGNAGYNQEGFAVDRDFHPDTNYTSLFNGTSAAAPMVSGVIALMLEANPNLSWRDVQEILVRSSRQNSKFDTLANGFDKATGVEYQSTWIVNQVPLFHDPDIYDPLISSGDQMLYPTLNPLLSFNAIGSGAHYAPTPQVLTNGAGYTVSQGRGTDMEQIGFAHGVVDAELAVALAKQWTTKAQHLPAELTFTTTINVPGANNLPSAEVVENIYGPNTVDLIVPGGLGGGEGFADYWREYLVDNPDFGQGFFARGVPLELTVPADNNMTVENVEVTISVGGGSMEEFLNNVRVVLVSPSGTHSELNYYFVDPSFDDDDNLHQAGSLANPNLNINGLNGVGEDIDWLDPNTTADGLTTFTFSTNRIWGERSGDALIIDPTTGLPIVDTLSGGGNIYNGVPSNLGNLLTQGWQLHFENYSSDDFGIANVEVAWHGSPINPETQRVQGLVGIDVNQDDDFNWSRVIQQRSEIDGDTTTTRLGEIINIIDTTHESMAANVTVVARRASDGAIVDQFVTGADGNFYFDLVPDNYIISIQDPEGRVVLNDTHNVPGTLQEFKTEWQITPEHFRVWQRDANLNVPIDANGVPLPFDTTIAYGMSGINFLLDPGAVVAPQVEFSGVVNADFNGDGQFNGNDVGVPNVKVFADVNRNGVLDSGEIVVTTNANGQYNLVVPATAATVINVGVIAPVNWTPSDPASGVTAIFAEPGDAFTLANGMPVNFEIIPPLGTSPGDGSNQAGYLMGVVYEDANNNGSRQATELGIAGIQVFIDANNNGTREINEAQTTTNANGAYIFANVIPGTHRVRAVPVAPLLSINPGPGVPRIVSLAGGGTVSQIEFGLGLGSNPSGNFDFGDLPAIFNITKLEDNGARHTKTAYWLGLPGVTSDIDVEQDGKESDDAGKSGTSGDDQIGADEDGIVVDPLIAGSTGHLVAYASRNGGYLQGWIDFNGDAIFQASEKVISNRLLETGENHVTFQIPATLAAADSATGGKIFARFRYGEFGINSVTGAALIGEVEDYLLDIDPSSLPAVVEHGPDFNEDGKVNGRDFLIWQRNHGRTNATGTQGDANGDGVIGYTDLVMWKNYYGTPVGALAAFSSGDDENPAPLAVDGEQVSNDLALLSYQEPSDEGELVEATLIVDTYGRGYGGTLEVSAQASTEAVPVSASLASAVQLWLDSQAKADADEAPINLEEDQIDALFGDSTSLTDLGLVLRSGKSDSSAYRVSDEEWDSQSEEDNAFELAFAEEADWLQL